MKKLNKIKITFLLAFFISLPLSSVNVAQDIVIKGYEQILQSIGRPMKGSELLEKEHILVQENLLQSLYYSATKSVLKEKNCVFVKDSTLVYKGETPQGSLVEYIEPVQEKSPLSIFGQENCEAGEYYMQKAGVQKVKKIGIYSSYLAGYLYSIINTHNVSKNQEFAKNFLCTQATGRLDDGHVTYKRQEEDYHMGCVAGITVPGEEVKGVKIGDTVSSSEHGVYLSLGLENNTPFLQLCTLNSKAKLTVKSFTENKEYMLVEVAGGKKLSLFSKNPSWNDIKEKCRTGSFVFMGVSQ